MKTISAYSNTLITRVVHSAALYCKEVQGAGPISAVFSPVLGTRLGGNVANFNGLFFLRGLIR